VDRSFHNFGVGSNIPAMPKDDPTDDTGPSRSSAEARRR